jgi:hypothetical protein
MSNEWTPKPQHIRAIRHAIALNELKAATLANTSCFAASFPAADAEALREVLAAITRSPATDAPHGQVFPTEQKAKEFTAEHVEPAVSFKQYSDTVLAEVAAGYDLPYPLPVTIPDEPTPEMLKDAQMHSEIGRLVCNHSGGGYEKLDQLWRVWRKHLK